ncbi:hypothetical protein MTP99_014003 [Tenebrio molitor]|jgi:aprataxin|nr:hypothetical protein MTP99_014003 [Tenebrio molitor]CAH1372513.1 unnamed protein product [Tenebrio molitor]
MNYLKNIHIRLILSTYLSRKFSINMAKRKSDVKATNTTNLKKPKTGGGGHWSLGLATSVNDPAYFVKSDDLVNVIKDKYPKAKYHFLIMPKEKISSLKAVTGQHQGLLKHMEDVATEIANDKKHEGSTFKVGYHAEASMTQLHLHVISDDMNSDCLKTKKHWNSFTTEFFVKSQDVRKNLEKDGKIRLLTTEDCKKCMETPLKCHRCDVKPKNMPALKKHILTHVK